ncbi:MAG: hypothetical protein Harvfovirus16_7, partial [Harvfovirus sp.]
SQANCTIEMMLWTDFAVHYLKSRRECYVNRQKHIVGAA